MKKNTYLNEATLERRQLQLRAIEDYFGGRIPEEQFKLILKGLKINSTHGLSGEDRRAVWSIRTNLEDPIYKADLMRLKNDVA